MKHFPIVVEFPDNYEDVDVLYNIMCNLPMNSYEQVGIRFKTNPVLNDRLSKRVEEMGLQEFFKNNASKTKS